MINTARIYSAMKERRWGRRDTCVNCHVGGPTLEKILDGEIPRRLDALYRLCDGLGISIEEVFVTNGGTHTQAERPKLSLVSGRRAD